MPGPGERHGIEVDILTNDEPARSTSAVVEPDQVTLEGSARALRQAFGPRLDADYVPGKTELRDALSARFELSLCVAEELCDELEQAERIRFVRTAEGVAWHIHADEETT